MNFGQGSAEDAAVPLSALKLQVLKEWDNDRHHTLLPLRGGGKAEGLRPLPPAPGSKPWETN